MHIIRVKSSDTRVVRFLALAEVQLGVVVAAALMGILLAHATGHSYVDQSPRNGKVSLKAVSWERVKKPAEPDAGLSGHEVAILSATYRSVIASGKADNSGLIEFEIPPGTYTLLGASDEPQTVRVQGGQTAKFKLIMH